MSGEEKPVYHILAKLDDLDGPETEIALIWKTAQRNVFNAKITIGGMEIRGVMRRYKRGKPFPKPAA